MLDGTEGELAGEVEEALRRMQGFCGVLLGGVITCGLLVLVLASPAGGSGGAGWMESPETTPFGLAFGAMLLILLASAARRSVLRRALAGWEEADPPDDASVAPAGSGARAGVALAAYRRSIRASFAMLAAAAALGLTAALLSRTPFYGTVICATSGLVMAAIWPRRAPLAEWLDSFAGPDPSAPETDLFPRAPGATGGGAPESEDR